MKKILIMFMMVILLSFSVNAFIPSFNNENVKESVTNFEWCFDNPFDSQKELYSEDFFIYQDNNGCDIIDAKLYVETDVSYVNEVCNEVSSCIDKTRNHINGTIENYKECQNVISCKQTPVTYKQRFDLKETDYLIQTEDRICYVAKRQGKTSVSQSCDMNFIYDNVKERELDNNLERVSFDVSDFGKLWWNTTWGSKYQINATQVLSQPFSPFRINFNNSLINMNDCNPDGSDVRILNATEDGEEVINISLWNATEGVVYVNVSLENNNWTGYLYCNVSSPVNSVSTSIPELALTNKLKWYFNMDEGSGNPQNSVPSELSDYSTEIIEFGTVPNSTGKIENKGGSRGEYSSVNYFKTTKETFLSNNINWTYNLWINNTEVYTSNNWITYMEDTTNTNPQMVMFWSSGDYKVNAFALAILSYTFTPANNSYHMFTVMNYANKTICLYFDAILRDCDQNTETESDQYNEYWVGVHDGATNPGTQHTLDEISMYNRTLSVDELLLLNNLGYGTTYPFYAEPSLSIGLSQQNLILSNIDSGLFNSSFNNISLNINEGQDFYLWVNYSFDNNSSSVIGATCNYSADNIIDEKYFFNGNTSLCLSGCDTANKTQEFTGLHTEGFIEDIYRFKICQESATKPDFTVSNNCGYSNTFSGSIVPLCNVGFLDLDIIDANCSGIANINLSIISDGVNLGKSLTLVDDFIGIDRTSNKTEDLVYNNSLDLWISSELHEYYTHGEKNITIHCNYTDNINPQDDLLTLQVGNIAPEIFFDTIWNWLLPTPVLFTDNIEMSYPLESTINITGICVDDDLQSVGANLTFENNTLIHEYKLVTNVSLFSGSINYTQANFSTELNYLSGALQYTFIGWCNDTEGNISTQTSHFKATNHAPTVTWDNSSPLLVASLPVNISWTCVDTEQESMTSYLWINDTLNTTTPNNWIVFNNTEGTYQFKVLCEDSFFNSSNATLDLSFSPSCIIAATGLVDGTRYSDTTIAATTLCANNISLSNCGYSINDYSFNTISNCSSFSVLAERGWNKLNLTLNKDLASESSVIYNFWAKSTSDSIFQYPVLWVMLGIMGLCFVLGRRIGIMYLMGGFVGVIVGFQLIAFSVILGIGFSIISGLIGLMLMFIDS